MSLPLTKLSKVRSEKFLSQEELARESGVSQATISHAESGRKITLGNIKKLAAALGVKPEKLL